MANLGEFYRKRKAFYKGPKSRRRPTHLRALGEVERDSNMGLGKGMVGAGGGGAGLWAEDPGKRNTVITL